MEDVRSRDGREDWEDWDDDVPSMSGESPVDELLVTVEPTSPSRSRNKPARGPETQLSASRYSVQKPSRLKSRGRQKAQNAQAGIKLVTDMSKFRKQQHIAQQLRPGAQDRRLGKFVDAAALRALEGTPTEASVGSWNWLKRKPKSPKSPKSPHKSRRGKNDQDLSPADRPIVIGIALPEDDLDGRVISPETATLDTPLDLSNYFPRSQLPEGHVIPLTPGALPRSVWSPDTEDGSPSVSSRAGSSIYSQAGAVPEQGYVPPVPTVPSSFKHKSIGASVEYDDDDDNTPVTLFEEDGSPVNRRKPSKTKGHARSPATTATRSGWWDHVKTPFVEQMPNNPFAAKPRSPETSKEEQAWWKGEDEKKAITPAKHTGLAVKTVIPHTTGQSVERSPTIASSSRSAPSQHEQQQQPETMADKGRFLAEENHIPTEAPPPYEPPSKEKPVRYRAVFPPGHALHENFPPSPGPISPGLTNTMTSQGAISMTDVPLTPPAQRAILTGSEAPLPDRPLGTFGPRDTFAHASGDSPAARIERQRRRHEKEDAVARKIEGFWKGRGCISENGCYGRRGREGRKRRRICLGVIGGVIAAIILIVVLVVTLAHRSTASDIPYSMWLNISGFPPIPTGVMTVVGPDNSEAVTGCVKPSTLWTCSLPKEEQEANEPYAPEQPKFIIQIQYDNNTRQFWNVPDGPIPSGTAVQTKPSTTSAKASATSTQAASQGIDFANSAFDTAHDGTITRRRSGPVSVLGWLRDVALLVPSKRADPVQQFAPGIAPQPTPPPFHEYWFLGNTTDKIQSDRKAGEPTPFFLSILPDLNSTLGPNMVTRRGLGNGISFGPNGTLADVLPPPALNPDGTAAPGVLAPRPAQQPLRLFDRGLPTEHYGFYSYFDKRVYVSALNGTTDAQGAVPADRAGGVPVGDARFVVTWAQVRFHVQIWTRLENSSALLGLRGAGAGAGDNSTRPGTFPYPVTVTEDNHGGNFNEKGAFARRMDVGKKVLLDSPVLVLGDLKFNGELINHGIDPALGGFDGGDGGCKCAWRNWVGLNGQAPVS